MIVKYLSIYQAHNPASSTIVQADSCDRFYRVIVTVPVCTFLFKKVCIPMFFIDGTFHKSKHYDGVLIQLCAKHGFGGTFQLMAAWLPRETAAHMAYFVMSMKEMGFDIENVPFMSI